MEVVRPARAYKMITRIADQEYPLDRISIDKYWYAYWKNSFGSNGFTPDQIVAAVLKKKLNR